MAVCIAGGVLAGPPAVAHGYSKGDLAVRHPWARATPPGAQVGAAYLEIRNSGQERDRVVGAATPAVERV